MLKHNQASLTCDASGFNRAELRRGSCRHPARAALAYLAVLPTTATDAALAKVLGLSRPEGAPNLARRFGAWLPTFRRIRM
jgi:hypothetical protein